MDLERGPEGLQRCHLPVVSPPHAAAALLGAVQAASLARRSQEAKESSCYFLGVLFSFLICSLQEATAKGCAGNAASHPSTASLLFIFYYRTDLLGRKPPHLLTKHLLNLPAVPPCPFPCINLPDYHCRPRTEREPSPSSGHLLHHLREADALPVADSPALGDAHGDLGCSPPDQGSLGCSPCRRIPAAPNMLMARAIGRGLSTNPSSLGTRSPGPSSRSEAG